MTERTEEMFSDSDLRELVRSVETDDYKRVDPPQQVWLNVLAAGQDTHVDVGAAGRQRQFGHTAILRVAAVVALIVGLGAVVLGVLDSRVDASTTIATAAMDDAGLPVGTDSRAWATIVCDGDECRVDVEFTTLPDPGDEALELWVIDADVDDMFSLGEVTGTGSFELPAGVTHVGFPVVDISVEPRDGDVTHSGRSVLRGVFQDRV